MNLTGLLNFESMIYKGAQTQASSINEFVAASLRFLIEHFFQQTAPSFLIIWSCRRPSPQNFYRDIMERLYNSVDNMIIQLIHLNHTQQSILNSTSYVNLLFVDSLDGFLDINIHKYATGYDYNEYYYIFLQQRDALIPKEMAAIFDYCWHYQLINCNVQIQSAKGEVFTYTFFPFSKDECRINNSVLINQFIGPAWKSLDFFPKKLRNFNNCPLTVMARNVSPFLILQQTKKRGLSLKGMEAELLLQLATHFNFSLELRVPEIDERSGNFCCGTYAMLQDRVAHLGIGYYRRWPFIAPNLTTTFPHYQTTIVGIIYLNAYNLSSYEIWSYPFNKDAWLSVAAEIMLLYIVFSRISRLKLIKIKPRESPILLNIIACLFGIPLNSQPIDVPKQVLYAGALLAFFLLRSMYSALLYHLFRNRLYLSLPQTCGEVFARNMKPVINQYTLNELLSNPYQENLNQSSSVILSHPNDSIIFQYLEKYNSKSLVGFSSKDFIYDYVVSRYRAGMYFIIPEGLANQHLAIWLQKHSFLVDHFNEAIMALHATGLINYWTSKHLDLKYFQSSHLFSEKLLGHKDFLVIYQVMLFLYFLSIVVFIIELLTKSRNKIRRKMTNKRKKKYRGTLTRKSQGLM